ncbi:MAG: glutaminase A [Zetaproteobacteria bacterium]|nr:glutaminase A [Zetaproteobacteria bacterium]
MASPNSSPNIPSSTSMTEWDKEKLVSLVRKQGLSLSQNKLHHFSQWLGSLDPEQKISQASVIKAIKKFKSPSNLALRLLEDKLVVPRFTRFSQDIQEIFELTQQIEGGAVANYIPQLQRMSTDAFAVSICTIDGQQIHLGDSDQYFCVQSSCKPINYGLVLEEHGEELVHQHVGHEPSGSMFNELSLNDKCIPHNPMINSGAIMCCSLMKPHLSMADRFDYVMDTWKALCGEHKVGFNNPVYLSERQSSDRNFAIAYFMREKGAFPPGVNLKNVLEFYFQCCSIEVTAPLMSIVAATLANSGTCPLTDRAIFGPGTIKDTLSLMYSCGMYNFSGEFAFKVGLPAKSGVSGVIMIVVPGIMGICLWSPPLDTTGNSYKGLHFIRSLVDSYNLHTYDTIVSTEQTKKDIRSKK